jgi:hypothetical protein
MAAAASMQDPLGIASADVAFHRVFRDASANEVAGSAWDAIVLELEEYLVALARATPDLHVFTRNHWDMRDQVATIMVGYVSLDVTQALCRNHINLPRP